MYSIKKYSETLETLETLCIFTFFIFSKKNIKIKYTKNYLQKKCFKCFKCFNSFYNNFKKYILLIKYGFFANT